jgi:hypothetical protein
MTYKDDPHGYRRLRDFLLEIAQELSMFGNDLEAELVLKASLFYGSGSPSEFLGESRRALKAVLESTSNLSAETVRRIRAMIGEIDEGFHAVGSG